MEIGRVDDRQRSENRNADRRHHDEGNKCDAEARRHHLTLERGKNSKRTTLQLLNRAASTKDLKTVASLSSFKVNATTTPAALPHFNTKNKLPQATIPAASREQAQRQYYGPTIRSASAWDAPYDSPGPQAYHEAEAWTLRFRNNRSFRIAKCGRDVAVPRTPGPGDYNVAHHGVGDAGTGKYVVKIGDPGNRYPSRTPDHPRAQVPCSYAEHVSCLQHQVTSDRARAPAFCFGQEPRFKVLN